MYSDDPIGNKPDTAQGGQVTLVTLTQRLTTIWKKYPLVSIFVFVLFIGCSVCAILTYRIFHDLSNDFTIHISGDLDQKLEDGYVSLRNNNCQQAPSTFCTYRLSFYAEEYGEVTIWLHDHLDADTYHLGSSSSDNRAQISVDLMDEQGINYRFDSGDVISGYVTIKQVPHECYEEIRGEFEVRLSKTGRFGTHKRTVDIEIKGDFDFDPYAYFDPQGAGVYCEPPLAW